MTGLIHGLFLAPPHGLFLAPPTGFRGFGYGLFLAQTYS